MAELPIAVRVVPPEEMDAPSEAVRWVINSWLKSYYDHGRPKCFAGGVQDGVYWLEHHALVMRLLRRGKLVVAHMPSDEDLFMGWACGDGSTLHYAYVKQAWRRERVASRMLEALSESPIERYTHGARRAIMEAAKRRGLTYSPYALITG